MKKTLVTKLGAVLTVVLLAAPAAAMDAKEVGSLVYKAERLSMSGKIQEADETLKQAEKGMEEILQGNDEQEKTKVKRSESKMKYVRKQLDRKLARSSRKSSTVSKPPESGDSGSSSSGNDSPPPLPDHAAPQFKKIGEYLDRAKGYIDTGEISYAKDSINAAKRQIQTVERSYGRYGAKDHPDILAAKKRIPELEAMFAGAEARKAKEAAEAAAEQEKVMPVIDQMVAAYEKQKSQINLLNKNPRVFMPARLDNVKNALDYYSVDYSGFEAALRTFTETFGKDQESINTAFKKYGLIDKEGLSMYVPGWIKSLSDHQESRKASAENIVKSAKEAIERKGMIADYKLKLLNEQKEILKIGRQIDPENQELNQLPAGIDDEIAAFKKQNQEKIDRAEFKGHISDFSGPGDVKSLAGAALEFFRNSPNWGTNKDRKIEILKVTVQGQWRPAEKNFLGYILSYRLPILLAYTTPEYRKDNLAKAIELSALTDKFSPGEAKKQPPFVNYWVGDSYLMRLDKVENF